MADQARRRKNARRKEGVIAQARADKRKRLLAEALEGVADYTAAPRRGLDPAVAIQEVLDNLVALYKYITAQLVMMPAEEYFRETIAGLVPNEFLREQERLGMQIVHVASKASAMGLAERAVMLQEAQAAMFGTLVEAALVKMDIGLDDRRKVHDLIAQGMEDIEAQGADVMERVA